MAGLEHRVRRAPGGGFDADLPHHERDVLRSVTGQLRDLLGTEDPVNARLFPAAYPDDVALEAEFTELVHGDLMDQRLERISVMERTVDAERLTEEEVQAWLGTINDVRLVLGIRLDVTEDVDIADVSREDPRAEMFGLYGYLTWLEEGIVQALSSRHGE